MTLVLQGGGCHFRIRNDDDPFPESESLPRAGLSPLGPRHRGVPPKISVGPPIDPPPRVLFPLQPQGSAGVRSKSEFGTPRYRSPVSRSEERFPGSPFPSRPSLGPDKSWFADLERLGRHLSLGRRCSQRQRLRSPFLHPLASRCTILQGDHEEGPSRCSTQGSEARRRNPCLGKRNAGAEAGGAEMNPARRPGVPAGVTPRTARPRRAVGGRR